VRGSKEIMREPGGSSFCERETEPKRVERGKMKERESTSQGREQGAGEENKEREKRVGAAVNKRERLGRKK
jgi:hypothetical protein